CCGILVGEWGRVLRAVRARNVADSPTRFLLDPRDHIAVHREARDQRLEIVGFYHSHPHSPPFPSPTDVAEWSYPDAVSVIVSLEGVQPETRAFRLREGSIEEEVLTVE